MDTLSPNGWPVLNTDIAPVSFRDPAGNVVGCANHDVATIFDHLVDEWGMKIEKVTTCNGFRRSNSVNPYLKSISQHQSGTAIDVNGWKHLYERAHPTLYRQNPADALGFSQKQLNTLRALAGSIKGPDGRTLIRLGIDFGTAIDPSGFRVSGWRDAMHIEIRGAHESRKVSCAELKYAADQIRQMQDDLVTVVERGMRGAQVRKVQRIVGVKVDGVCGDHTVKGIKRAQQIIGVPPDGRWGPRSEHAYDNFCDGALGKNTTKQWMHNARVTSLSALVRKIQARSQTLTSVQTRYKLHGEQITGKFDCPTWRVIQDAMGFHEDELDGIAGIHTISSLQRRIVRGRW